LPEYKLEVAGEMDMLTGGATVEAAPDPASDTASEFALVYTFSVPLNVPADVGEKDTVNCIVCAGHSLTLLGRPDTVNALDPEIEAEFTNNEDDPLLLTVIVCCLLEPVVTVPKLAELGLIPARRLNPIAEPVDNSNAIKAMG
jgi:hypothetical protein